MNLTYVCIIGWLLSLVCLIRIAIRSFQFFGTFVRPNDHFIEAINNVKLRGNLGLDMLGLVIGSLMFVVPVTFFPEHTHLLYDFTK